MQIRPATPEDIPQILTFIRELATYEREPHAVLATEADLLRDGFGPTPRFQCIIAEVPTNNHNQQPTTAKPQASPCTSPATPPGEATTESASKTSTSPHPAEARESAKPSFAHLARIAVDQGCPRLEWDVLAWNTPAIAVYESIGAQILTEWRIMRLSGEALTALAR